MAGTGAFLVLAAATVFVATHWEQIPEGAKLAALGLLTGACLLAGRRLAASVPGTAGSLWHLGAFLIPVDVAAVALRVDVSSWARLTAGGLVAAGSWILLDRLGRPHGTRPEPTVPTSLLARGSWAAVVVAAVGLAGLAGVPLATLVVAAALVAALAGAHRAATGWAALAGLAPLAGVTLGELARPGSALQDLGLAGLPAGGAEMWATLVAGLAAATVLFAAADRDRDPVLAAAGMVSAIVGMGTAWWSTAPPSGSSLATVGALILTIELAVALARRDQFWAALTRPVGVVTEVAAGVFSLWGAWVVLAVAGGTGTRQGSAVADSGLLAGGESTVGAALGLGAVAGAWIVADLRRRQPDGSSLWLAVLTGAGWTPATVGATAAIAGAVVLAAPAELAATLLSALAIVLVISGRPMGQTSGAALAVLAPILAAPAAPELSAALGTLGVLVVAWGTRFPPDEGSVWLAALACPLPLWMSWPSWDAWLGTPATLLVVVAVSWTAGWMVDGAPADPGAAVDGAPADPGAALLPRLAGLVPVLVLPFQDKSTAVAVSALLVAGLLVDVWWRRTPLLGLTAAVSVPALVLSLAWWAGLALGTAGLALAGVGALATLAAGELRAWRVPLRALSVTSLTIGALLTLPDPASTATLCVLVGALGVAAGARQHQLGLVATGGLAMVVGVQWHLVLADVASADAYVAPVALWLTLAGVSSRRGDPSVSSWLAYSPGLVLLGGSALVERIAGGGGGHALVAGSLGVAAVAIGGARQAGRSPLLRYGTVGHHLGT